MTLQINLADFWKELDAKLDAKLDARFAAFEAKLDVRFAKIETRLDKIDKRLDHIQGWMNRQDNILERESTVAIYNYLRNKIAGSYVFRPDKGFPKQIRGVDGKMVTDLDGVIVLTTNPNYERQAEDAAVAPGFVYRLVIVEAKQHLTLDKYKKKIHQRSMIQALLINKDGMPPLLKKFGFHMFVPEVGLYFGANDMDPAVMNRLQQDAETNPWMGWLDLSGARYVVKDTNNSYGDVLEGYSFGKGGRRRMRKNEP